MGVVPSADILKVFSQSLLENVEVFKREDKRIALISCICMGVLVHSVPMPHALQVWGIVSFILSKVFPQPS